MFNDSTGPSSVRIKKFKKAYVISGLTLSGFVDTHAYTEIVDYDDLNDNQH